MGAKCYIAGIIHSSSFKKVPVRQHAYTVQNCEGSGPGKSTSGPATLCGKEQRRTNYFCCFLKSVALSPGWSRGNKTQKQSPSTFLLGYYYDLEKQVTGERQIYVSKQNSVLDNSISIIKAFRKNF